MRAMPALVSIALLLGVLRAAGQDVTTSGSPPPMKTQGETPSTVAEARTPVDALGALSSRVRPGDRIYVHTAHEKTIVGTFSSVSDRALTVWVKGESRSLPASDVRQVSRRGGSRARLGMLVGFVAGAVLVTGTALSDSDSDWSGADKVTFGVMTGGTVGLVWGGLLGLTVHPRVVVYRPKGATANIAPLVTSQRAGLLYRARF